VLEVFCDGVLILQSQYCDASPQLLKAQAAHECARYVRMEAWTLSCIFHTRLVLEPGASGSRL
jgi:hypothetical protein